MSRSNPTTNTPNPATRFFEWNGEQGTIHYYDKTTKQRVDMGSQFSFILLDQLAVVKGWHEPSQSGIYSNEVRDTRIEPMTVKAFKGGVIGQGLYASIKDKVAVAGGKFTANCYVAFKGDDNALAMGAIQFKGGALSAWFEFVKANRADIYSKAVLIDGFTEGQHGRVKFRVPAFKIIALGEENNDAATAIDRELQTYLAGYFERTKTQGVARDAVGDEGTDAPHSNDGDESPFNEGDDSFVTDDGKQPPADYRTPAGPQGKKLLNQPGPRSTATVGSVTGATKDDDLVF